MTEYNERKLTGFLMKIGRYSVESIVGGRFGLDGGAMFGIVPAPLWSRTNPPDDKNRIELAARSLLIRDDKRCILVETGLGDKFDDKRAGIFDIRQRDGGLVGALREKGVAPGDITDVVLTHLHFDHCGGTTRRDGDGLALVFPEATHHVQRQQWEWAWSPSGKDAGSYRQEDFSPLEGSPRLRLVDGEVELFDAVRVRLVDGHTPAMQLVEITGAEESLLFCADLVPTKTHLRWPYIMAYDNQPLVTLAEKRDVLPRAAASGQVVVFGHDPLCDAVIVRADGDAVVVDREISL